MTPKDFLDSLNGTDHSNKPKKSINEYSENSQKSKILKNKLKNFKTYINWFLRNPSVSNKNDQENNIAERESQDLLTNNDVNSQKENPEYQMILNYFEQDGLINYYDYVFLHSILSKSSTKLHLAFELLDYNGDNFVDINEYNQLEKFISKNSSKSGRENNNDKNLIENGVKTGCEIDPSEFNFLKLIFFGEQGDEKLTSERFKKFCYDIHREILWNEFSTLLEEPFDRSSPKHQLNYYNQTIPSDTFVRNIFVNTDLPETEINERALLIANDPILSKTKISFKQFITFNYFLTVIDDILEIAKFISNIKHRINKEKKRKNLKKHLVKCCTGHHDHNQKDCHGHHDPDLETYHLEKKEKTENANEIDAGLTKQQFYKAIKISTGKDMDAVIVDILFALFDKDGDNTLSYHEVASVFKSRLKRSSRSYIEEKYRKKNFMKCLYYAGYQRRLAERLVK